MLLQSLPDPRTEAECAVTERFGFRCTRCSCSANLTIEIPDAPAFEGRAEKRPRDAFAPRRPRQRAQLLAALLPCPTCGKRSVPRTLLHLLGTLLRAAFALGLVTVLAAVVWSDDMLIRQLTVSFFATLILAYGIVILVHDVGLLRRRRDVHWTEVFAGR